MLFHEAYHTSAPTSCQNSIARFANTPYGGQTIMCHGDVSRLQSPSSFSTPLEMRTWMLGYRNFMAVPEWL
jgi:hypothetical protein